MKNVIILRGISGSGKSTYTAAHFPTAFVASADKFFERGGTYKFDPAKLGTAHAWCASVFEYALRRGDETVVVDNTNTKLWEFKGYLDLAAKYGYDVTVIRLKVDPKVAAARNLHGVPADKVQQMQDRFQDFEGEEIVDTTTKDSLNLS
jgi:2',3'-cyclic-nucleotide 3'-phosphodiesterase